MRYAGDPEATMRKSIPAITGFLLLSGMPAALCQGDPTPAKDQPRAPKSGAPAANAGDANGNFIGKSRGNGKVGFLTPRQQSILANEPGGQSEIQKLNSMSQNDRLKLQTRLQKKWDGLSQEEKNRRQAQLGGTMTRQTNGISLGKSPAETAGTSAPSGSEGMRRDSNRGVQR
jgi:hypothetical protein